MWKYSQLHYQIKILIICPMNSIKSSQVKQTSNIEWNTHVSNKKNKCMVRWNEKSNGTTANYFKDFEWTFIHNLPYSLLHHSTYESCNICILFYWYYLLCIVSYWWDDFCFCNEMFIFLYLHCLLKSWVWLPSILVSVRRVCLVHTNRIAIHGEIIYKFV